MSLAKTSGSGGSSRSSGVYGSYSGKSPLASLLEESDESEAEKSGGSFQKTSLTKTMRYNEDTQSFLKEMSSPRTNDSSPALDDVSNRSSVTSPKLTSPEPTSAYSSSSRARRRNELSKTSTINTDLKSPEKQESPKREKSSLSSLDDSDFLKTSKKTESTSVLPSGRRSSDSSPRSSKSPQGRLSPLSPDLVASPRSPLSSYQRKTSRDASLSPSDRFSKTLRASEEESKADSKLSFKPEDKSTINGLALTSKKESSYGSLSGSSKPTKADDNKTRDSTDDFLDSIFGEKAKNEKPDLPLKKESDSPDFSSKRKEKEIDPFSFELEKNQSPKSKRRNLHEASPEARKRDGATSAGAGDRVKKGTLSPKKCVEEKEENKSKTNGPNDAIASLLESSDDNTDSPSKSKSGKKDADDKTGKKENFKEESKNSKAETAEEKQKTSTPKRTAKSAGAMSSSLRHKQLPLTSTIALFQPPPPTVELEPEPGSNLEEWPETDVIRQRAFSAWYEQKKAENQKVLKVQKEKIAEEKEKEEEKKRNQRASAEQFEQWKKEKDKILHKTWKEKKEKEKEREKEEKEKEKEKEKLTEATFKKWSENKQKQQMEEKKRKDLESNDSSAGSKKSTRPSSAKSTSGGSSDRNGKTGRDKSREKVQTMTPEEAFESWEKKKAHLLAEEQKKRREKEKKEMEEHESEKDHRKAESRKKFDEWKQKKKEEKQTERPPGIERPPFRPNSRYKQSSSSPLDFYSSKQQMHDLSMTLR